MKRTIFLATMFASVLLAQAQIPYCYEKEYSGKEFKMKPVVKPDQLPLIEKLPDPFKFQNGKRSTDFKDWEQHRYEISQLFQQYEIGMRPVLEAGNLKAVIEDQAPAPAGGNRPGGGFGGFGGGFGGFGGFGGGAPDETIGERKQLKVTVKHNGQELLLTAQIQYPKEAKYPCPALLGVSNTLPTRFFTGRGCAIINIDVFAVTQHTQKRGTEPINKLYPELEANGSYCFWGWCVSRIIDGLQQLGPSKSKVDTKHLAISGCSWAGKCALYCGAFDERIALVIAHEPGGGGIASWRYSETLGEVERSFNTNDSWFFANIKTDYANEKIARMPVDHHELAAMVCPRALLYFGNTDYKWLADESGYVSINAAKEVWKTFGIADRVGYSISGGHGHCQLPEAEYPYLEAFIDRFLLDKHDVKTEIANAPMFKDVDWRAWIADWK